MEAQKNVAIDEDILSRAREIACSVGMTPDEFATEAVCKKIARRALAKIRREGEASRWGMSDDQVDEAVNRAVQEYREQRSR